MCWPIGYRFLVCIKGWSENSILLALTDYRIRRNPQDHATASGITAELNEPQPLSTIIKLIIIASYRGPLLYPPKFLPCDFHSFQCLTVTVFWACFQWAIGLTVFWKMCTLKITSLIHQSPPRCSTLLKDLGSRFDSQYTSYLGSFPVTTEDPV